MQKFEQYYVALWCLTMPVTSFILVPIVQGTILAYVLGIGSIAFVLIKIKNGELPIQAVGYFKMLAIALGLWLLLFCGSQIGDMLNRQLDIGNMFTISAETSLLFRASLFTQSLYLFACVMIAIYFRYFFQQAWMKYVYWGAWFFALYGLYDWAFFLVFHESGDFLANRSFEGGDHPGSWSQTINIGGLELLRFKSTVGEPSFVSVVIIPYIFLAIEGRKPILTTLLFACAILSTSTTVILGLTACIFINAMWSGRGRAASLGILGLLALALIALAVLYPETYRFLFADKLSGDTDSGRARTENIAEYYNLFSQFGPINWLFGVGFGNLYFSLLWSITGNTGLVGIGTFLYMFLKPAYLLPRAIGSEWLKMSMIAIVVVAALSLTELFTPTTWMFLGLAYRRLDQLKMEAALPSRVRPREESLTPAFS